MQQELLVQRIGSARTIRNPLAMPGDETWQLGQYKSSCDDMKHDEINEVLDVATVKHHGTSW